MQGILQESRNGTNRTSRPDYYLSGTNNSALVPSLLFAWCRSAHWLPLAGSSPYQPITTSDRRISSISNMSLDQTIAAPSPSASANGPTVSPELFWETAWGFQKTAARKAAIELDVFTKIGTGAHGLAMLAEQTGAARRGLRVLCDYLTISGFLEKAGEDYNLTPSSQAFLDRRSPSYFGSVLDFIASPQMIGRTARPSIVRRSPDSMASPSLSKVRASRTACVALYLNRRL